MGDTDKAAHRRGDIDTHLRRAFNELEQEELPDRLLGLLDRLRSEDAQGDGEAASDESGPSEEDRSE